VTGSQQEDWSYQSEDRERLTMVVDAYRKINIRRGDQQLVNINFALLTVTRHEVGRD